jgi:hypothetical protein
MIVTRTSLLTRKIHSIEIDVDPEKLEVYEQGEGLAQDMFPNLTPDEREFIITGITKEEWNVAFSNDE